MRAKIKKIKKKKKLEARYIPLKDIKDINDTFLNEINAVRGRLAGCNDKELINEFYTVILSGYKAAIELKTLECIVDYDIKFAKIEARAAELSPWRRCWLWRLLLRPLTNRAQDIIEERAELDADAVHTAAETAIEIDRKKLYPDSKEKLSKRELRRKLKKQLKAAIKKADEISIDDAFREPAEPGKGCGPMENAGQATEPPEPPARKPRKNNQQLGV